MKCVCICCNSGNNLTKLFLEWEMFQAKVVEKTKTNILR